MEEILDEMTAQDLSGYRSCCRYNIQEGTEAALGFTLRLCIIGLLKSLRPWKPLVWLVSWKTMEPKKCLYSHRKLKNNFGSVYCYNTARWEILMVDLSAGS